MKNDYKRLTSGRPYALDGLEDQAAAVLSTFQPGQEGADAIADLLTGKASPCGRLVVLEYPKNVGAVPYYYNHKLKSGGTPIAYHFGSKYSFGYDLSYTRFEYSALTIQQGRVNIKDGIVCALFNAREYRRARTSTIPMLHWFAPQRN